MVNHQRRAPTPEQFETSSSKKELSAFHPAITTTTTAAATTNQQAPSQLIVVRANDVTAAPAEPRTRRTYRNVVDSQPGRDGTTTAADVTTKVLQSKDITRTSALSPTRGRMKVSPMKHQASPRRMSVSTSPRRQVAPVVSTSPRRHQLPVSTSPRRQQLPVSTSPRRQQLPVSTSPRRQQPLQQPKRLEIHARNRSPNKSQNRHMASLSPTGPRRAPPPAPEDLLVPSRSTNATFDSRISSRPRVVPHPDHRSRSKTPQRSRDDSSSRSKPSVRSPQRIRIETTKRNKPMIGSPQRDRVETLSTKVLSPRASPKRSSAISSRQSSPSKLVPPRSTKQRIVPNSKSSAVAAKSNDDCTISPITLGTAFEDHIVQKALLHVHAPDVGPSYSSSTYERILPEAKPLEIVAEDAIRRAENKHESIGTTTKKLQPRRESPEDPRLLTGTVAKKTCSAHLSSTTTISDPVRRASLKSTLDSPQRTVSKKLSWDERIPVFKVMPASEEGFKTDGRYSSGDVHIPQKKSSPLNHDLFDVVCERTEAVLCATGKETSWCLGAETRPTQRQDSDAYGGGQMSSDEIARSIDEALKLHFSIPDLSSWRTDNRDESSILEQTISSLRISEATPPSRTPGNRDVLDTIFENAEGILCNNIDNKNSKALVYKDSNELCTPFAVAFDDDDDDVRYGFESTHGRDLHVESGSCTNHCKEIRSADEAFIEPVIDMVCSSKSVRELDKGGNQKVDSNLTVYDDRDVLDTFFDGAERILCRTSGDDAPTPLATATTPKQRGSQGSSEQRMFNVSVSPDGRRAPPPRPRPDPPPLTKSKPPH